MNAPYEPLLHALSPAHDVDPEETAEWREALLALIGTQGPERARQILDELATVARQQRTGWHWHRANRAFVSHRLRRYRSNKAAAVSSAR